MVRSEQAQPSELIHIDIKKLGRFAIPDHRLASDGRHGWEYAFVIIDDHSRLAHAAIFPNERYSRATAFLREWAYGRCFASAVDRADFLRHWLHHYN